jgi:UDP-glucose 4-epimerase
MIRDISAAAGLNLASCATSMWRDLIQRDERGRAPPRLRISLKLLAKLPSASAIYGTDYDTPDGTCVRDFIHVTDLALAHVATYEFLSRSGRNACFNCGSSKGYSVLEVLGAVEQAHGRKLQVVPAERRPGDPSALIADASAIRKTLGWRTLYGLEDMIHTALAWERREHGDLTQVP